MCRSLWVAVCPGVKGMHSGYTQGWIVSARVLEGGVHALGTHTGVWGTHRDDPRDQECSMKYRAPGLEAHSKSGTQERAQAGGSTMRSIAEWTQIQVLVMGTCIEGEWNSL